MSINYTEKELYNRQLEIEERFGISCWRCTRYGSSTSGALTPKSTNICVIEQTVVVHNVRQIQYTFY